MSKVEHLNTPEANELRDSLTRGTTSKSDEYLVFHYDKYLKFALVKWKGGGYSSRGYNYVPGDVKFYALDSKNIVDRRPVGTKVWDCCTTEGNGRFTYKRSLQLIKSVESFWKETMTLEQFKNICNSCPGLEVSVEKTIIGRCILIDEKYFWLNCLSYMDVEDWLVQKSGSLYCLTNPEFILQEKLREEKNKEERKNYLVQCWVNEISACSNESEVSSVVRKMLKI